MLGGDYQWMDDLLGNMLFKSVNPSAQMIYSGFGLSIKIVPM